MSHTGVYQIRNSGRYYATLLVKNKLIRLGGFDDEEQATQARIKAEEKYKYNPLKAGELKIINDRIAKVIQKLICSRWSKTNYKYEPIIEYGV